jgi:transcriptional regulator with XRE-family HTH domain
MTADQINKIRTDSNLTIVEFAQLMKVPYATATNWLYGRRSPSGLELYTLQAWERQLRKEKARRKIFEYAAAGAFGLLVGYIFSQDASTSETKNLERKNGD